MVAPLRMTMPTQAVLKTLLQDPQRELYGLDICHLAGLPSGTIHPILARLERLGWLESRWETAEQGATASRRPRRYYRFTTSGADSARQALAGAYQNRHRG